MPWNCLCSSDKERHKLEISAPILNRDGNAKIIQSPANDGNPKIINSSLRRNANQTEINSNYNLPNDSRLLYSKSLSKQKQRSKKNAKNAKDLHAKFQSGEQQSPNQTDNVKHPSGSTIDHNANASLTRRNEPDEDDTTYTQLVFERKVNKPNEPSSVNILSPNNLNTSTITTATAASHHVQHQDSNTGHYDRLPFDKLPSKADDDNGFQRSNANHENVYVDHQRSATPQTVHGQLNYPTSKQSKRTETGVAFQNGDTIPFIDDEDVVSIVENHNTQTHLQINEGKDYATTSRIITLHPKNIGSNQTIQRGKTLQRAHFSNNKSDVLARKQRGEFTTVVDSNANVEVVSRSITASPATANQNGRVVVAVGVHEFFPWNPAKGKLCQVCHASALNGVVKCRSCDLVTHLWCASKIMI